MLGDYIDGLIDLILPVGNLVFSGLLTASAQGGGLQSL